MHVQSDIHGSRRGTMLLMLLDVLGDGGNHMREYARHRARVCAYLVEHDAIFAASMRLADEMLANTARSGFCADDACANMA
jgi:hypothetical protein